ncbi:zinc finger BED domain-containing protein RICESLEEPER 2-like [Pistacia vera]|uniref:zinc finger BED domain-containing protein RICESLEEPER 2-like n=1 Tax=Pistacia vera TaxID=55513 RepID=UPI001263BB98|nr:zinc finger BED domain-containing protein RICESLEEPER 2-like [Pistacia vera]
MDNATSNDVAIRVVRENFQVTRELIYAGKLFHVCLIKIMLDKKSEDEDDFIRNIVRKMKEKFNKYRGECNLLMVVAAVLDPRLKMKVIQWSFPKMYPHHEAWANTVIVWDALYEVYGEYVNSSKASTVARASTSVGDGLQVVGEGATVDRAEGLDDFTNFMDVVETFEPSKYELDFYLGKGCHKCVEDLDAFDALQWWKANSTKYPILSTMAHEILAILITTVASESAFSARSRVVDTYRSLLSLDTVEMLQSRFY